MSAAVGHPTPGQWYYAFVIDGRGGTLYHPLLPTRFSTSGDDDRPLLDIADLETTKEATHVINSMKRLLENS